MGKRQTRAGDLAVGISGNPADTLPQRAIPGKGWWGLHRCGQMLRGLVQQVTGVGRSVPESRPMSIALSERRTKWCRDDGLRCLRRGRTRSANLRICTDPRLCGSPADAAGQSAAKTVLTLLALRNALRPDDDTQGNRNCPGDGVRNEPHVPPADLPPRQRWRRDGGAAAVRGRRGCLDRLRTSPGSLAANPFPREPAA